MAIDHEKFVMKAKTPRKKEVIEASAGVPKLKTNFAKPVTVKCQKGLFFKSFEFH